MATPVVYQDKIGKQYTEINRYNNANKTRCCMETGRPDLIC